MTAMSLTVWLPALFVLGLASMGAANVAFDAYERLGLRDFMDFEAQSHTPSDRWPATALPVPIFHRLERASFS
jgi:hypothetical protein